MKKLVIALLLALAVIGFFLLRDEIPSSDDLSSAVRTPEHAAEPRAQARPSRD